MSVKQSLLAILDQGPCYGYQLRAEYDRRTGSTWPLNVGQIYNTLERLERDGLTRRGDTDAQGHVFFEITDAGHDAVRTWLESPVVRGSGTRDELAVKLALAVTLPGVDAAGIIRTQRRASRARLDALTPDGPDATGPDDPAELASTLIAESLRFAADAEVRWLDALQERLSRHPGRRPGLGLATRHPRRGRPAASAASSTDAVARDGAGGPAA